MTLSSNITQYNINLATIVLISLSLIFLGGSFFYLHNSDEDYDSNPLYWSLGIGLSSTGGAILIGMVLKNILPIDVYKEMIDIKSSKI